MKRTGLRVLSFCCVVFAAANMAAASQFVIILHNAAGWQFQGAEKLTINGKSKLRSGAASAADISQDAYKRLPEVMIGSAPLRLHRAGYLLSRNGSAWAPIFPDGASFKGSSSPQALWTSAVVVIQADRGSKDQALRVPDIFAILPGAATPAEAAAAFLADEANFRGVGETSPAEAFDERMSLLVGVAGTATGPAQAKVRTMLSDAMTSALQKADSAGTGRFAALIEGLLYVPVAEKAFPADAGLAKLSAGLRDKLAWLNQRMAIVKALGAATEWDALIDKYGDKGGDLGDYDDAFPDLRQLHERSNKESETFHTEEAKRLYSTTPKQCIPAQEQILTAKLRNPGSRDLEAVSEEIRLGCIGGPKPVSTVPAETPAQTSRVTGFITSAGRSMGDGKFEEAEAEIKSAEAVYPDSRIVLARAKLLRARKNLKQAIDMLNRYDTLVSSDAAAMDVSAALRADIEYDIRSGRENARQATAKAEADGDYPAALAKAAEGLNLDPIDPELLFHAGLDAVIVRNVNEARKDWQAYLNVTSSQPAENKRRTDVRTWLAEIGQAPAPAGGSPNWFSGATNATGLMYDTASLAINVRPTEVRGSKKLTVAFEWKANSLLSVHTESLEPFISRTTVYFDYYPGGKSVRRVSTEAFDDKADPGSPKMTTAGAVGAGKGTYVALYTDPSVNPFMIEKLTGKSVATIVAGNPYFNPYVWDGVYSFIAEYDSDGRVKSATPIKAGSKPLDFQWDGNKLVSIVERGGEYRRDLKYDGSRLTEEVVAFRGKNSRISYKYSSGRLEEADCDADASLDGRSRHVAFGN